MPVGRNEWALVPSVASDLDAARIARANLLLVGNDHLVTNVLRILLPYPCAGVLIPCENGRLQLPPAISHIETVVVRDLETLTLAEQHRLLAWLDSATARAQVVSTATAPLLPLVETGAFSDTLYYRLNTVYIDLSE